MTDLKQKLEVMNTEAYNNALQFAEMFAGYQPINSEIEIDEFIKISGYLPRPHGWRIYFYPCGKISAYCNDIYYNDITIQVAFDIVSRYYKFCKITKGH